MIKTDLTSTTKNAQSPLALYTHTHNRHVPIVAARPPLLPTERRVSPPAEGTVTHTGTVAVLFSCLSGHLFYVFAPYFHTRTQPLLAHFRRGHHRRSLPFPFLRVDSPYLPPPFPFSPSPLPHFSPSPYSSFLLSLLSLFHSFISS